MAINSVQIARTPAPTAEPKTIEESWSDKVLKGLQIARGVLGIGVDIQSLRNHQSQIDDREASGAREADKYNRDVAAQEAEARGELSPMQEFALRQKGGVDAEPGAPNSTPFSRMTPAGKKTPLNLAIQPKAEKAASKEPVTKEIGGELVQFNPETNEWKPVYAPKPKPAGAPKPEGPREVAPGATLIQKNPTTGAYEEVYTAPTKDAKATQAPFAERVQGLKGEDRKRFDSVSMGINAVDDMTAALGAGDNTFSVYGDNNYTVARREFEEALGRMQSGGAISQDEEARFKKMAPDFRDSEEVQKDKLRRLSVEMSARAKSMGFAADDIRQMRTEIAGGTKPAQRKGEGFGEAKAGQGQAPGSIVEIRGKRYLVGSDGESLTPIGAGASGGF